MVVLILACLLLAALYFYYTRTFNYWATRGVKHDYPIPFFGTNIRTYLQRVSVLELATEVYNKYPNERLVGSFKGTQPELIVRDPELAKNIMTRDFSSFHRRGVVDPSSTAVLMKQPVFADDDMWRQLRLRWTPAFSSSRIKAMFSVIIERAKSLQARLRAIAASGQTVDAKDLMSRFTVDVVGPVGFSVACDSVNNDDDAMRQMGIKILSINVSRVIIQTLQSLMPETFKHLNLLGDVEKDVIEMVQSFAKQRDYEPSGRHDFIDLLLEVKKRGAMTGESIVHMNDDGTPKKVSIKMDDAIMAAQSFAFFLAGFETTSSVSSYTLHELAHNPRVQEKAQEEIDRVLAKHDNKISYEAISEMTYLRWCLYESIRVFPFPGITWRQNVRPFTFPGTNITIEPGVMILIPIEAYHNDPKIFPEPQEYRPERFDPAVMTPEQKVAFLPFGSGPRACVGERFGVMLTMSALATTLSQCSVRPAPGAPRRPILSPVSTAISLFKNGIPLSFQERKSKEDDVTLTRCVGAS